MKNLFIIILLFTSLCLWAQNVPQTIDYQGRLADSDGNYLNVGVTVYFLIYDAEYDGTLLWNESQDVSCANGVFHIQLGSSVTFPTDLFAGADRWLELVVGDETLSPRTAIASVPYAIKAETAYTLQNMGSGSGLDADLLDGQDSSDFMPVTTDNWVNTSGDTMTGNLVVNADFQATGITRDSGGDTGTSGQILSSTVTGTDWIDTAATGDITAVTAGTGLTGGGTSGDVTLNVDVPLNLTGNVASPNSVIRAENTSNGTGVRGTNTSTGNYGFLGSYSRGVYGKNYSDYGSGIYGLTDASTGGYGVWGLNWGNGNHGYIGSTDFGVFGEYDSSNNYGYLGSNSVGVGGTHGSSGNSGYLGGLGYGVYGNNSFNSGKGVYGYNTASSGSGVYGQNSASSGSGVNGYNTALNGYGVYGHGTGYYGGYFTASYPSSNSHAVHAEITGTGAYDYKAVYGKSRPTDGYGHGGYFEGGDIAVYGQNSATGSLNYHGMWGVVLGGTGTNYGIRGLTNTYGTNYAVYGFAYNGSTNYAGYFSGNLAYTGSLINASDERFKENIQPLKQALSKIMLMKAHTYNYKQMAEEKQLGFPEGEQIGLIAQELEEILPVLVSDNVHAYDRNEGIEAAERDMEKIEYKGINYIGLIPVLIEAMQEQQKQYEEQQEQIEELQQQIRELK